MYENLLRFCEISEEATTSTGLIGREKHIIYAEKKLKKKEKVISAIGNEI